MAVWMKINKACAMEVYNQCSSVLSIVLINFEIVFLKK